MGDEWERAELGACLMVALGCRCVSVLDAVVWVRHARDVDGRLF